MANCPQSVIPEIIEDSCNGNHISSNCVIHELAIVYLSLSPNSTLTEVLSAYLVSLVDARNRITTLENIVNDHEIRITALENA